MSSRKFAVRLLLAASFSSTTFAFTIPYTGIGPRETIYPWYGLVTDRNIINVTAFGDSILSGLDTDANYTYLPDHGLVERLGKILSQVYGDSTVLVHNRAIAGSQTPAIHGEMELGIPFLDVADYFILDGGGNDFLRAGTHADTLCDQATYDGVVTTTKNYWESSVDLSNRHLKPTAKKIYMTLHYGRYNQYKATACPSGVGSPFSYILVGIAKMNYLIGQLAIENHAQVIDNFGMFICAPSVRASCDPRLYPTESAFVAQILRYEEQGLLGDATMWKGDDQSPAMSVMQADQIHPNELGHLLLSNRLFELLGF